MEAGALARVARRAGRLDERQDRVVVAVEAKLLEPLDVAGRGALVPELLARARPEPHLAGRPGALERLVVHVREREHLAGAGVLHDAGQQVHSHTIMDGSSIGTFRNSYVAPISSNPRLLYELLGPVGGVRDMKTASQPSPAGASAAAATAARAWPRPRRASTRPDLVDLREAVVHVQPAGAGGVVRRRGEVPCGEDPAVARVHLGELAHRLVLPPERLLAAKGLERGRAHLARDLAGLRGLRPPVGRPAAEHDQHTRDIPARLLEAGREPRAELARRAPRACGARRRPERCRPPRRARRRSPRGPRRGSRSPATRAAGLA